MNKVFVIIGLFLVVMYVYLYTKMKKNKEKTKNINSVRDFNNSYKYLRGGQASQRTNKPNPNSPYNTYVTKYNSSEDYREKM